MYSVKKNSGVMQSEHSQRYDWVDALKGVGITLVVLGHAVRGIHAAGLMTEDLFTAIDTRIYAFHMPLFFFLSGFFLTASLARTSFASFIRTRTTNLLYPMVLWTYIFLGCKYLAGSMTNKPVALSDIAIFPLPGYLHFWFLWTLIVVQAIGFVVARSVPFNYRKIWPSIALLLAISVYAIDPKLTLVAETIRPYLGHASGYAMYVFAGAALFPLLQTINVSKTRWLCAVSVFLALLLATPALLNIGTPKFLVASALSICLVLCVRGWKSKNTDLLPLLGVASLAIYVAHTIVSAAFREVAIILEVTNTTVHILGGTLVGVLIPFWAYRLAMRWGIAGYVGWR